MNCFEVAINSCSKSLRNAGPAKESCETGEGDLRREAGAWRERDCLRSTGMGVVVRGEANETALVGLGTDGDGGVSGTLTARVWSIGIEGSFVENEGL